MDHLPYPNLGVPPIVVPYLSGFEYDGEDFATFPERVGFWKDGTLDLDRPCRQLAALAQAWLFFGLIDVFCGQHVDKGRLIRRDNNKADEEVVDTTALGEIVAESIKRQRGLSSRFKVLEVQAELMKAARASSTLDRIQEDNSPSSAVFLSVKILIIYLSEIFETAFWWSVGSIIPSDLIRASFRYGILERKRPDGSLPAPARLLMDRMCQSGWCIHQIMEILRDHNYCTVYYYSSIARAESWEHISHEACTEAQCVAYNIKDSSAYKIRHVEECSGCELVGPPEDKTANIVRKGDIPLVELNSASLENQTQLEVKPATAYSRYTAISHVWIDGHGNPTANTLPRCQLQRLATRLSAISNAQQSWMGRLWRRLRDPPPKSHLLWMDTLCIPPQQNSEDRKFLRKKAIHRMALIYVGAKQVLVLDAELNRLTYEGSPRGLTDALISCSRWSGRCWTLEEGALARKCLFQFKDVARQATRPQQPFLHAFSRTADSIMGVWTPPYVRMPRVISSDFAHVYVCHKLANAALRSAQTDMEHALRAANRTKPDRDVQADRFVRTWNDLGRRSTTRPEDIHPIMANLTDFKAAQIMALETPVLRTKMIVHCIGRFPLDLLWTPCARPQANKDSADRWIPSIPGPEPLVEQIKLKLTDKGFTVDAENYSTPPETFWIPRGMVAPRFCFCWSQNKDGKLWYMVECIIAEDDTLPRSASETACLILSSDTASERETAALQVLRGARLLVTKGSSELSEPLYLRYDCPLVCTIQRHRPDYEQIHDIPIMTVDEVSRSREIVIESTFNPKESEKLSMRSRDFYHSSRGKAITGSIYVLIAVVFSMPLLLLPPYYLKSWKLPFHLNVILVISLTLMSFGVSVRILLFILRWNRARAYNAWKATFEEDWAPRDSLVRRFVKAVRLPRGQKRRDQKKEHMNV